MLSSSHRTLYRLILKQITSPHLTSPTTQTTSNPSPPTISPSSPYHPNTSVALSPKIIDPIPPRGCKVPLHPHLALVFAFLHDQAINFALLYNHTRQTMVGPYRTEPYQPWLVGSCITGALVVTCVNLNLTLFSFQGIFISL